MSDNVPLNLEDTQDFPPYSDVFDEPLEEKNDAWLRKRPRFKQQELIESEDGTLYLVFRRREEKWQYVDDKRKKRRKVYRVVESYLALMESEIVNPKLATRIRSFTPGDGETEIHGLYRKSCWKFSWLPVCLLVIWLIGLTAYLWNISNPNLTLVFDLSVIFLVILGLCTAVYAWFSWAPDITLITNKRLALQNIPPLSFPASYNPVLLEDVTTAFSYQDVNWFVNKLGRWCFGYVLSDTAADTGDEWMHKMAFIRYHDIVADTLNKLMMQTKGR